MASPKRSQQRRKLVHAKAELPRMSVPTTQGCIVTAYSCNTSKRYLTRMGLLSNSFTNWWWIRGPIGAWGTGTHYLGRSIYVLYAVRMYVCTYICTRPDRSSRPVQVLVPCRTKPGLARNPISSGISPSFPVRVSSWPHMAPLAWLVAGRTEWRPDGCPYQACRAGSQMEYDEEAAEERARCKFVCSLRS